MVGVWAPSTTAERRNGGYVVNGRRFFCSQADGMDVFGVNALDKATGETLVMMVDARADGVEIVRTWDTTGMRATTSHDVVLRDVFVPEAAVGVRLPAAGEPLMHPGFANVARWFLSLVSSVYLGIAEEARAEAHRALGRGINSNSRDEALTDVMLGELEAEYLTALAVRGHAIARLERRGDDPQADLALATLCKEVVTSRAAAVVDKAVAIAGGKAYFRTSPLERLSRDIRAARFHPPAAGARHGGSAAGRGDGVTVTGRPHVGPPSSPAHELDSARYFTSIRPMAPRPVYAKLWVTTGYWPGSGIVSSKVAPPPGGMVHVETPRRTLAGLPSG